MKLNKILMAFAAIAIVGCSSDDLSDFTANQAPEDARMIQLDPNFVIAGVGNDGDITRTHWEFEGSKLVNKFLPIYKEGATFANKLDVVADLEQQAVGLCWLNQGGGPEVYTNYQFYHFGWLAKGESKPKFDECTGAVTNGALYSKVNAASGTEKKEAKTTDWGVAGLPAQALKAGADNLNYNSGIYKTDNKAIFGGQYIVYYPFNEDFKEIGTIPAVAETQFDKVSQSYDAPEVGQATFRYSAPVEIKGGAQASGFGMYNLSTLVQLRVAGPKNVNIGKNIDQIVLWSKKEQLLKQANLAADKIVAGKKGTELYAEGSRVGTKTIVASFAAAVPVNKTNGTGAETPISAYITALPTTVEDLVVFVHSEDGKWATVNQPNTTFEDGAALRIDIPVTADDFKTEYIAVDETTLNKALTDAHGLTATINVIGDITLTANKDINEPNITIKGDKIIVPQDKTLTLNTKMESDIDLLGTTCCDGGTNGAKLVVNGGTISNVTMFENEKKDKAIEKNPTVTFQTAASTVAAGKTLDAQAGTIDVKAAVAHKANINIAEGVKLTVEGTGDLNFMGSTVVNDGTIEVKKSGKFDMTDASGNATATDGQRMTNNGTFIHNVDAGVGTAVQSMNQNGEYRCRVDKQIKLDDAFLQWTACSVIEMVNTTSEEYNLGTAAGITPTAYKHNGEFIDIEVNCGAGVRATFTNPTPDNNNIQIGNLSVKTGTLWIDYVNTVGSVTGKRELTVNGDMTVADNTRIIDSKKISVTGNLNVEKAILRYLGNKANEDGLAVTGNINVKDHGTFGANEVDAIKITCANFTLAGGSTAEFGNRTEGDTKNMVVSGTIKNPDGCTFDIKAANQNGAGSVLAWISCKQLNVGGTFTNARPRVE